MNSQSAVPFETKRNRRRNIFLIIFIFAFADVDFDDFEVFDISDKVIIILIDTLEDILANFIGEGHRQEFISTVDESVELNKGHFPFRSE